MAEKRLGLFRMRKNKGSSAASAKQPKAAAQSQPVQDGKKRTQEQDRGHSDRTLKMFPKFMSHRKTNKNTEGTDKFGSRPTDVSTASIECAEMTNYVVKADQVPAMVRIMHERLSSPVTADVRLFMNILRMADEHPPGVVLTLLRCAPTCDRFAVQTMKALLCRLQCDNVVTEMGRKCGWDTLLCAQTQHYAMGLLAREMRRDLMPLCFRIACHLLGLLSTAGHRWDRPFLAFLVEVFDCLDLSECRDRVLEMMSRYLQSECRERGRLALRGLMVLIKDPLIARRMGILSQRLVDVLGDADREVVRLSLSVFMNVLQYKDILISSTTAPKLAEALLPLFDHDHSHVQLLSIQLFEKVMDLVVDQGKKPLKRTVSQSLLPLFLHCHDENQHVANASMETLLCAARFLKKRSLKQAVKKEMPMKFGKCLLQENRSRAAELLLQALPYLESPQEPLREAAIRFIGMAARYLKGQPGELHVLSQALEAMSKDDSPSSTNLEIQAIFGQRCAELRSSAGFGEPVSQEQYQEPVKRTSPLSVTGEPGMDDARHS
ncbi:maestro heat-like repeat-containing protein family member 6 isoform X3 [Hirundo rustica]|uniref:maestro heat-like repeat-containing protein family member 6 isoform X3 n=1 Tax=Hirundo rustica TaxID=43150 RepID=UPI001A94ED2E|nr:maestro heat-like repeat-containing protein family member 6 isoform X3 [Hirundo rustica]XP_039926202.1 maestro heat-like repeat-containing protein family member 6 isoform X3 [Hirundo rustica]